MIYLFTYFSLGVHDYGECVVTWLALTCCFKAESRQHSEDQQAYSPSGLYGFKKKNLNK